MPDEQIVDLFWSRQETAIDAAQEKYHRYLTKIARNILDSREDAEEGVNDTYLAAWHSIPPHKPQNLATYLGKLTRRICIDIFRKKNRDKRKGGEYALSLTELEDCIADSTTPEDTVEAKQLGHAINAFVRSLPREARNLFIGRYYYLDPLKEVARYCGVSESKAKSTLFRTRCALRDYLIKEGYDL